MVVYYLGAGASANAVPVVKDFIAGLRSMSQKLNEQPMTNELSELINAIDWLVKNASTHASVDTYAKKLFLKRDHSSLNKLKAVLSTFLVIHQSTRNVDLRYDSLFASILNEKSMMLEFPENLGFLSWNYDTQLEKAYYGFCENTKSVIDNITFNSKIHRINGFCGVDSNVAIGSEFRSVWEPSNDDAIYSAATFFKTCLTSASNIYFAWERDPERYFEQSKHYFEKAETVVIIGYSFPYFNRKIDRYFVTVMNRVKKVYLQCIPSEQGVITERLKKVAPHWEKIVSVNDLDTFFIPDELANT